MISHVSRDVTDYSDRTQTKFPFTEKNTQGLGGQWDRVWPLNHLILRLDSLFFRCTCWKVLWGFMETWPMSLSRPGSLRVASRKISFLETSTIRPGKLLEEGGKDCDVWYLGRWTSGYQWPENVELSCVFTYIVRFLSGCTYNLSRSNTETSEAKNYFIKGSKLVDIIMTQLEAIFLLENFIFSYYSVTKNYSPYLRNVFQCHLYRLVSDY